MTNSRQDMKCLKDYDWPGNVRELSNVVERALILSPELRLAFGDILNLCHKASVAHSTASTAAVTRLEDMEREHIVNLLEKCGWRVCGEGAAELRLSTRQTVSAHPSAMR